MSAEPELAERRPPTRRTVAAAGVLVVLLIGGTIVAQRYTAAIDGMARSLAEDAAPSIERLSSARGDLRRMTFEARDALRAVEMGEPLDRSRIDEARGAFDAAMSAYLGVAPYPKEIALRHEALARIEAYRAALASLLVDLQVGDRSGARRIAEGTFMPASNRPIPPTVLLAAGTEVNPDQRRCSALVAVWWHSRLR